MNFAHVMMDIMMTEPPYAHLVLNSVKLVLEPQIIVSFVLRICWPTNLCMDSSRPISLS
jgi:hypothetical protein